MTRTIVNQNLDIRALQESDLPFLPDLYKTVFNVEKDEPYWRWKYYLNPAGEHMRKVAVELDTKRVVGSVGTIPVYMLFDGKKILTSQACDVVIIPDFQKRGLFYKLHEMTTLDGVDRGIQLMYGFSVPTTLKI